VTEALVPEPGSRMISIAGQVGSGKTTVARLICDRSGRELFSTGRIFRHVAERMGMTVLQLNEYALTHADIDDEVDGHLRSLAAQPRPVVIDSRMAFFFVPASYRVYLIVDPEVGGARVYRAGRRDESYRSITAAEAEGKARERVEANRYHELYGVLRDDWRNYDLIVDTTDASAELVTDIVLTTLTHPAEGRPRCFLSPRRLLPLQPPPISDLADSPPIDVAVAHGLMVVVDGHRRVAGALTSRAPLIECRLAAFEDETWPNGGSARQLVTARLTETTLRAWEARFGISYGPRPPWIEDIASL
jgi:cytidylate kinase